MGISQREVVASPERAVELSAATNDIAKWPDELLTTFASGTIPPWHIAEIRQRLRETAFADILAAIDLMPVGSDPGAPIALYRQWIEANNHKSPLLYAAWFNVGVLFGQA